MSGERPALPGEVIQIDPAHEWGPALAIVTESRTWGVTCFCFVPARNNMARVPLRIEHGHYSVIGVAAWLPAGTAGT